MSPPAHPYRRAKKMIRDFGGYGSTTLNRWNKRVLGVNRSLG